MTQTIRQGLINIFTYLPKKKNTKHTPKMTIFLCILLISLLTFVSLTFLKKLKHQKWKLPPSPSSFLIIGNLHNLLGLLPHRCFHQLSIKYGPILLLRLGLVPVVLISSSELAEDVLKTYDLNCCSRPNTVGTGKLSYGFKDISFAPYGEYWREMRKIAVIELFSLKKVQSFRYIREEEIDLMVQNVSKFAMKQCCVDLSKMVFSLTASIIFRVALGKNFHESDIVIDKERIEELVTEAATALGTFTFSDFYPGKLGRSVDWLFQRHKRINKVFEELDVFYEHVIKDHLKDSGKKSKEIVRSPADIVALMLDMIDQQGVDDSFKLNMDNVKAVLMDVFLARIDTSAVTMIWAMTELVRNPKVMKKAQEEIRKALGSNRDKITEDDINKVDYLKLIIKETFRLHTPVPFLLPRETMYHIKIQGYDIPPKTKIYINAWTIGRDPKRWTDPENFVPERFIDSPIDYRGQHFGLIPFGSGRRSCPAMSMGVATVELGLLNLLYFFDWGLPDGMEIEDIDMEEEGSLTIVKKIPLELVPTKY